MQQLKLQFIQPEDARWQAFVQQQPKANIFHHPSWLELLKECYGYQPFVLAWCDTKNGMIQAGLPVMEVHRPLRGRRWVSLPFSDHCIPLTYPREEMNLLIDLLQHLAKEPASPPLEVRWNVPECDEGQPPAPYVLHLLRLESNFHAVEHRIHHSHRRNVRIALDHGIQIRRGTDQRAIEAFYRLHLETRRRQGVPIQPAQYFRLLKDILLKKGLGFISLAYHGSECLAGAVFLHWNQTLTYKYGASSLAGLSFRPNHLIFWDAIRWGCSHGYSVLDFGRSDYDNSGLRMFKSRWGAQETLLQYFQLPNEIRASNRQPLLRSSIQSVIRNAPAWVCKLGGEIYYRMAA